MIRYLAEDEIIQINKLSLTKDEPFVYERPDDVQFTVEFVKKHIEKDYYKKSLGYCIALIVLHPFKQGNHRTSLYCSQLFLLKNKFTKLATIKTVNEIQKWRAEKEYENNETLVRKFFQIANIEDVNAKIKEMLGVMNSEYGVGIENWLRKNYKK